MAIDKKDNKNLLLNQIIDDNPNFFINELVPTISGDKLDIKYLTFVDDIYWSSIYPGDNIILNKDSSGNLIIDVSIDAFSGTDMYFRDGQVGIGRLPLHAYKVDIGVPVNTRMTALHIGDGVYGFSLGNATDTGFLPQIIGMGSDSDDAGLYFLGKANSNNPSSTPSIIFDGRDALNNPLENRPIMGISSGSYSEYKFLIHSDGSTIIDGNLYAENIIILDSSNNIQNLRKEIEYLKARLDSLENNV